VETGKAKEQKNGGLYVTQISLGAAQLGIKNLSFKRESDGDRERRC